MECRCYRGGQGRTRLRVLVLDKKDYAVTILTLAVFAISIVMSYTIVWGVITR